MIDLKPHKFSPRQATRVSLPRAARSLAPSAMAQLARQREALAGGALEGQYGGEGLGDAKAAEKGRPVATPVNLVPAASAVEATAGNKKHDDDDEKGSAVHGSLLAKSN